MCSYCPVSHIRREPEAETKDFAEASEAAAAKHKKQQKNGSQRRKTMRKQKMRPGLRRRWRRECGRQDQDLNM